MNERQQRVEGEAAAGQRIATPVLIGGGTIAALVIGVAIWYFLIRDIAPPEATPPPSQQAAEPAPPPAPVSRPTPAPTPDPAVTLPALSQSDAEFTGALGAAFGAPAVERYLNPGDIIRKLVVTIDNLARPSLPLDWRVVQATPGLFVVAGPEDARYLSADNYARYTPFVNLVSSIDARTLVSVYERYYPLMQEAYLELGNPDTVFSTRVIAVIDHLLATPNVSAPVDLVQPKVLYEYRDPELESRSSGQKILMRIGPDHANIIKARLREIRALLTQ
jgi:hypothetical protein